MDANPIGNGGKAFQHMQNHGLDPRHIKGSNKGGVSGGIVCFSEIVFDGSKTDTDLHDLSSSQPGFKFPVRALDVVFISTAVGGSSDTAQLKKWDGSTATAISDAVDMEIANHAVVRAGSIDDVARDLAKGETFRITIASGAAGIAIIYWTPIDVPVTAMS